MAKWRALGEFKFMSKHHEVKETLLFQFLYINSTFSPAPDDTVLNLFKVSNSSSSPLIIDII